MKLSSSRGAVAILLQLGVLMGFGSNIDGQRTRTANVQPLRNLGWRRRAAGRVADPQVQACYGEMSRRVPKSAVVKSGRETRISAKISVKKNPLWRRGPPASSGGATEASGTLPCRLDPEPTSCARYCFRGDTAGDREVLPMSHVKRESNRKCTRKAAPVLGAAGLLALASSGPANASVDGPALKNEFSHQVLLGEEEISDVSLATFHIFDTERAGLLKSDIQLARGGGCGGCGGGGCRGCGGGGGCGGGCARGCGGGCRGGFFIGGCGGCGGCSCAGCGLGWWGVYGVGCAVGGGCCLSWGACRYC
jgi:hypothetical protein